VSWHSEDGFVVLSLWDGPRCTGTVRLATEDVPALVEALQLGLTPPASLIAAVPVGEVEPAVDDAGSTA